MMFTGYQLNKKYITAAFCVNVSKPELQCNGKCYLMKKLKQAQEKEQKQERQSDKPHMQDALVESPLRFTRYAFSVIKHHVPSCMGMPQSLKNSIFHPPQLA